MDKKDSNSSDDAKETAKADAKDHTPVDDGGASDTSVAASSDSPEPASESADAPKEDATADAAKDTDDKAADQDDAAEEDDSADQDDAAKEDAAAAAPEPAHSPSRPRGNSKLANVATNAAVALITLASAGAIGLGIWLDHSNSGDEVANVGSESSTSPESTAPSTSVTSPMSAAKDADAHEIVHLPPTVTEVSTQLNEVTVTEAAQSTAPQTVVQTQTQTQQVTVVREVPVTVEVPVAGGGGGNNQGTDGTELGGGQANQGGGQGVVQAPGVN